MRKTFLSLFVFIFILIVKVNGQDIITKKNGDDIQAKVIEITLTELKYKNFNNLDGPLISILKSDVIFVKYENGTKDVFADEKPSPTNSRTTILEATSSDEDEDDAAMVGKADAKRYYRGYTGAGSGTLVTGLFAGSIFALIPAIATSSSAPKEGNLQYPKPSLMKNPSYVNAYQQEAFKIKKQKVWNNYFIAMIANVATYFILVKR
ncbi:hypothetical protein U8591_06480 [Aquirufa antheringensis]|jgi:hypothetical protein